MNHQQSSAVEGQAPAQFLTFWLGEEVFAMDIKTVREAEGWDTHPRIEDVMDLESFVHLRTRFWKSLREEHAGVDH